MRNDYRDSPSFRQQAGRDHLRTLPRALINHGDPTISSEASLAIERYHGLVCCPAEEACTELICGLVRTVIRSQ